MNQGKESENIVKGFSESLLEKPRNLAQLERPLPHSYVQDSYWTALMRYDESFRRSGLPYSMYHNRLFRSRKELKLINVDMGDAIVTTLDPDEAIFTEGLATCSGIGMRLKPRDSKLVDAGNAYALAHFTSKRRTEAMEEFFGEVLKEFTIEFLLVSIMDRHKGHINKFIRQLVKTGHMTQGQLFFDQPRHVTQAYDYRASGIILCQEGGGFTSQQHVYEPDPRTGKEKIIYPPGDHHLRQTILWHDSSIRNYELPEPLIIFHSPHG